MKKFLPLLFLLFGATAMGVRRQTNVSPADRSIFQENDENMVLVEGFRTKNEEYDFWISRYEVTQELYEAVMGSNPSYFPRNPHPGEKQARRPVEFVTWFDAVYFCNKLTALTMGEKECCYTITNIKYKTDDEAAQRDKFVEDDPTNVSFIVSADVTINHRKKGFRLPTRSEWLFAAKGGLKSRGYKYAGSDDLAEVAWCLFNSREKTHEVGLLKPNELGLFDMTGNVHEYCEDLTYYHNRYGKAFPRRIQSGGGFRDNTDKSLISYFKNGLQGEPHAGDGIRLVRAEIKPENQKKRSGSRSRLAVLNAR